MAFLNRARGTVRSIPKRPTNPDKGWRPSPSTMRMLITAAIFGVAFIVIVGTSAFWVNWWWFDSMGYRSVLTAQYSARVLSFILGGLVAAGLFAANVVVARRRTRTDQPRGGMAGVGNRLLSILLLGGGAVMFLFGGLWSSSRWQTWLLWRHGRDFGVSDPIFNRDAGFYVFALPALKALRSGLLTVLLVTMAAVVVVYAIRLGVSMRRLRTAPATMRVHVFAIGGAMLLVLAASYLLANYELVYSSRGVTFGPGYTDVNVQRIANWLLAGVSVLAAALLLLNAFVKRVRLLVGVVILWGVLSVVVGVLVPAMVQQVFVEPSELKRERPYIANNIEMTRTSFGLDDIVSREISGQQPVDEQVLSRYPETISNIRLWDYRIIRTTFQQVQSFVPYYVFRDVDVERYTIDGEVTAVLLSAREIDADGLPENAQTWTNRRLVYTHGYGVVVSPVNGVSRQGLPTFLVNNIPPSGAGPLTIERPEIYFGEQQADWVITNSEQEEYSGLEESEGGHTYAGTGHGSIQIGGYFKKLMVGAHLGDRNIVLSGALTGDSRVHLHRDVVDRTRTIAPWLTLDPDPYMVIADGRLYWIVDGYTATDRFPGATRERGVNYMRNSVKVVIDAYDGTTTFYRTSVPDPIADAYGAVYDDLLAPIGDAPPAISAHFRYPEMLFNLQSEVLVDYHVTDPTDFYNGEDRWSIPLEQVDGAASRMEPFYVTMTLPGDDNLDFTLIRPFIPGGRTDRQNMTSWMAGQATTDGASRLVVYQFPRQETIFGPRQIDARISQDPDISSQISLWNQSGSRVIRGNMLVIPLEDSILYAQPLYLEATGTEASLPELRQVIVASNEGVAMRDTLDKALAALTDDNAPAVDTIEEPLPTGSAGGDAAALDGEVLGLAQEALGTYERAQAALQTGDWETYGREQAMLEEILRQLAAETGAAPSATPGPAATPAT